MSGSDLKRALAAYVSGRNGGWDPELKIAGEEATTDSTSDGAGVSRVAAAHHGVAVPEQLRFGRGPGTWRSSMRERSNV